ncbi:MAG: type VI secretion protein [Hyphomicrobiales bacterium]
MRLVLVIFCLIFVTVSARAEVTVGAYEQCIQTKLDDLKAVLNQRKCLAEIVNFTNELKEKNISIESELVANEPIDGEVTPEIKKTYENWTLRQTVSAMDDTSDVVFSTASKEVIKPRFGEVSNVHLIVRCIENTTGFVLSFGGEHMADYQNYGKITYRLDKNRSKSVRMVESTDNRALGLWRGGKSIPFIKGLFGHNNLLIRYTPFNQNSNEVNFNIEGLERVIKPLRKACAW